MWGPALRNTFYEDARKAIHEISFEETVFADDLNSYREFPEKTPNKKTIVRMLHCQSELHAWGRANQVVFEPTKETFHILSVSQPFGDEFKLLGVDFDTSFSMHGTVQTLTHDAGWKLKMLIRPRRYFNIAELVMHICCPSWSSVPHRCITLPMAYYEI